jgi:hypothetical protein
MRGDVQRQAEHAARVERIDDAVIPEPRSFFLGLTFCMLLISFAFHESALIRLGP